MNYGFASKLAHENKIQAQNNWAELREARSMKHYVFINGRDCEVPSPNYLSVTKMVKDAINPLHLK